MFSSQAADAPEGEAPAAAEPAPKSPAGPIVEPFPALNDVVCKLDVMIGTASMSVRDCIQLRRDDVIRLSESAGGDLEVLVNGVVIGHGEVVIVDDSTAVRMTDVIGPPSSEAQA